MLQGHDAEAVLNRICANDIAVSVGKSVYTQWLNERGTIEADLTVTRVEEHGFLIVTAPTTHTHVHTLRIEKAYREFGHDLGTDDTPIETGLGFACDFGKAG